MALPLQPTGLAALQTCSLLLALALALGLALAAGRA
jgi:hypothetical protein